MSSFFILIWKSNLSCTLLPTFPVPVPLHLTKTYISKKQILVKKNWGAGRRSHFGPWEVCLCDCSLLFSLLTSESRREHFQQGPDADSICWWMVICRASASIPRLTCETSSCWSVRWMWLPEWAMLPRLGASENFHWTLCMGFPKQVKSPWTTENSLG